MPNATSAVAASGERSQPLLRVEDSGPGVSEPDRERIFEAFAQSEAAHADLGGAGLGLAIARRLARAMGGEVDAVNRNPGAEFQLWVPGRVAVG